MLKDPEARKKYHREYMSRRLKEDPEFKAKHLARVYRNDARYRDANREQIRVFKEAGCALCSEKEPCCLSAHHKDPSQKDFEIGDAISRKLSVPKVRAELAKCICLCENCHRKVHAGVIKLP